MSDFAIVHLQLMSLVTCPNAMSTEEDETGIFFKECAVLEIGNQYTFD